MGIRIDHRDPLVEDDSQLGGVSKDWEGKPVSTFDGQVQRANRFLRWLAALGLLLSLAATLIRVLIYLGRYTTAEVTFELLVRNGLLLMCCLPLASPTFFALANALGNALLFADSVNPPRLGDTSDPQNPSDGKLKGQAEEEWVSSESSTNSMGMFGEKGHLLRLDHYLAHALQSRGRQAGVFGFVWRILQGKHPHPTNLTNPLTVLGNGTVFCITDNVGVLSENRPLLRHLLFVEKEVMMDRDDDDSDEPKGERQKGNQDDGGDGGGRILTDLNGSSSMYHHSPPYEDEIDAEEFKTTMRNSISIAGPRTARSRAGTETKEDYGETGQSSDGNDGKAIDNREAYAFEIVDFIRDAATSQMVIEGEAQGYLAKVKPLALNVLLNTQCACSSITAKAAYFQKFLHQRLREAWERGARKGTDGKNNEKAGTINHSDRFRARKCNGSSYLHHNPELIANLVSSSVAQDFAKTTAAMKPVTTISPPISSTVGDNIRGRLGEADKLLYCLCDLPGAVGFAIPSARRKFRVLDRISTSRIRVVSDIVSDTPGTVVPGKMPIPDTKHDQNQQEKQQQRQHGLELKLEESHNCEVVVSSMTSIIIGDRTDTMRFNQKGQGVGNKKSVGGMSGDGSESKGGGGGGVGVGLTRSASSSNFNTGTGTKKYGKKRENRTRRHMHNVQLLSRGTPEMILDKCTEYWNGEDIKEIDANFRKRLVEICLHWRNEDLEIFAFSYNPVRPQVAADVIPIRPGRSEQTPARFITEVELEIVLEHKVGIGNALGRQTISTPEEKPAESRSFTSPTARSPTQIFRSGVNGLEGIKETRLGIAQILDHQIFLGMLAAGPQPKIDAPGFVELLMRCGVRFVYMSKDDPVKSKALARSLGLFTDWNAHISLKDKENKEEPPVEGISKLPCGISAIRDHLAEVDDVPLLVSLFTDCDSRSMQEMIKIYQENGENVLCLSSSFTNNGLSIASQADMALSLDPPKLHPCIYAIETNDLTVYYASPLMMRLSKELATIPSAFAFSQGTQLQVLFWLLCRGRTYLRNLAQCMAFFVAGKLTLFWIVLTSNIVGTPPPLYGFHILWFLWIIIPVLSLSLLFTVTNVEKLDDFGAKNLNHFHDIRRVLYYFLARFIVVVGGFFAIYLVALHEVYNGMESVTSRYYWQRGEGSDLYGDDSFSSAVQRAQALATFLLTGLLALSSASFLYRTTSLWNSQLARQPVWLSTAFFTIGLQVCFTFGLSHNAFAELPGTFGLFAVIPVISILAHEIVKNRDEIYRRRVQKQARVMFDTLLGMHSPK